MTFTNEPSIIVSNMDIVIRLLVAMVLSGLIGMERKHYRKPAGFRTNILVGLGSATLAILSLLILKDYSQANATDVGRIIGQVVTGIGFLGAGAIIQSRGSIRGFTTAATLWVVAAIGMSTGLGYYFLAIVTTLIALIVLEIFGRIEFKITEQDHIDNLNAENDSEQKT